MMINSRETDRYFALLDEIFEMGCTVFDTAHDYGRGDNERMVGRWVNERDIRDQVVIIGKGAHHNQDRKRVTPFDITSDLHDSLARFKFDYIDIYLLHRDDTSVPVGPIIEILNEYLQVGLIKAIGASNWTHQRIQEANEYAESHGLIPFIASSPQFSLAEQKEKPYQGCISISGPPGQVAREWYNAQQLTLLTWSSLAGGFLSGRFTRTNLDGFSAQTDRVCIKSYAYEMNFKRLERVRLLAEEKGLTVPQIALAYLFSQPLNIFAIVGCRTSSEFRDNSLAVELSLSPKEVAWLELETNTLS